LILLDAYALVAFVREEPAAAEVEQLLRQGETTVTAYNFAEALDVLQRVHRLPDERVRGVIEPLLAGDLELVPTRAEEAWRAGALRVRHYRKRVRELSLADCILLAHGGHGNKIATADPAVVAVARAERIETVALPDSSRQRS
jgi:predicted nucleic acid-binding protein